MVYQIIEYY